MKQFLYAINALSFSFLIKLKMIHKCNAASFVFLPTDRILIILKLKADDAKFFNNIYGRKTYSHSFPVFLNGIFLKLFRIFHPFSSRSGFFFWHQKTTFAIRNLRQVPMRFFHRSEKLFFFFTPHT